LGLGFRVSGLGTTFVAGERTQQEMLKICIYFWLTLLIFRGNAFLRNKPTVPWYSGLTKIIKSIMIGNKAIYGGLLKYVLL
jgi:hypothetical protein